MVFVSEQVYFTIIQVVGTSAGLSSSCSGLNSLFYNGHCELGEALEPLEMAHFNGKLGYTSINSVSGNGQF